MVEIVLISGLSGAGKSLALAAVADVGYYCVDNLPLAMLPAWVDYHIADGREQRLAVCADMRSHMDIGLWQTIIADWRQAGYSVRMLFLEAGEAVLLSRFALTRRSHPLVMAEHCLLPDALRRERGVLQPLRREAYCVDTSDMNPRRLRLMVQQWLTVGTQNLVVAVESFGFKYGAPSHFDFVFDMRSLPNPYYEAALRPLNGLDEPVARYLAAQPEVGEMVDDIEAFMRKRLPAMVAETRSYVSIGIGCTGGQHRSVYVVRQLAARLGPDYTVLVRHRQLAQEGSSVD